MGELLVAVVVAAAGVAVCAGSYRISRADRRPALAAAILLILSIAGIALAIGLSEDGLFFFGLTIYAAAADAMMGALLARAMTRPQRARTRSARKRVVVGRFAALTVASLGAGAGLLAMPRILDVAPTTLGSSSCMFGMVYIIPALLVGLTSPVMALAGAAFTLFALFGWEPAFSRPPTAEGRCAHCGYLLFGLLRARCPGCGMRFDPSELGLPRPEPQRPRDARCESCGYSLRGLATPRCPECGTHFDPSLLDPSPPGGPNGT